jgi:hypothetical protein
MPLVMAPEGLKCPKEGKRREYITDDPKGVEVPDTIYYRRLLAEGSLLEVIPDPPVAKGGEKEGGKTK